MISPLPIDGWLSGNAPAPGELLFRALFPDEKEIVLRRCSEPERFGDAGAYFAFHARGHYFDVEGCSAPPLLGAAFERDGAILHEFAAEELTTAKIRGADRPRFLRAAEKRAVGGPQ